VRLPSGNNKYPGNYYSQNPSTIVETKTDEKGNKTTTIVIEPESNNKQFKTESPSQGNNRLPGSWGFNFTVDEEGELLTAVPDPAPKNDGPVPCDFYFRFVKPKKNDRILRRAYRPCTMRELNNWALEFGIDTNSSVIAAVLPKHRPVKKFEIVEEADLESYWEELPDNQQPQFEISQRVFTTTTTSTTTTSTLPVHEAKGKRKGEHLEEDEPLKKQPKSEKQTKKKIEEENQRKEILFEIVRDGHPELNGEQIWKWVLLIIQKQDKKEAYDFDVVPEVVQNYGRDNGRGSDPYLAQILKEQHVMQKQFLEQQAVILAALFKGNSISKNASNFKALPPN